MSVLVVANLLSQGYVLLCSAGQPYCSAKFLSLRTGDEVHNIPYTEPITDIRANDRYAGFDEITSNTVCFSLPRLHTKFSKCMFSHTGLFAWNNLPEDIRTVLDTVDFRKQMKTNLLTGAFYVQRH